MTAYSERPMDWLNADRPKDGFVYFIQASTDGPIKVGFAKNPNRRLAAHQVSNAAKLRMLYYFPAMRDVEAEIQKELAASLIRGEWYYPTKSVLQWIREQKSRDEARGWRPTGDFIEDRVWHMKNQRWEKPHLKPDGYDDEISNTIIKFRKQQGASK